MVVGRGGVGLWQLVKYDIHHACKSVLTLFIIVMHKLQ